MDDTSWPRRAIRARSSIYSQRGRFLQRLGRWGSGPGEFIVPLGALQGPGDSVHVLDRQLRRWSVFSPRLRFVRSIPVPLAVNRLVGVGRDGSLLVEGSAPTPSGVGLPMHRLNAVGELVASFGDTTGTLRLGSHPGLRLREATAAHDRVYVATPHSYEIEVWSSGGRLLRVLGARPPWFRPWTPGEAEQTGSRIRLHTTVAAVRADRDGRLWVFVIRPKAGPESWWSPPGWPAKVGGERPGISMADLAANYFTTVDVIDVRRDTIAASYTFEDMYVPGSRM